jgi:flagellar hook-associated protein 1 FlgK
MAIPALNIGLTALNAAQAGMVTTSHNIANASTPGYHRQEVLQQNNFPVFSAGAFFGRGVAIDSVRRNYSLFVENQLMDGQTQVSQYNTYHILASQLDNMLGDSQAGLSSAIQTFFNGVQEVANNPSSVAARQNMVGAADVLMERFRAFARRFDEIRSSVENQISDSVSVINDKASQIANLNGKIAMLEAGGFEANDLRDQRDQLVSELNQQVKTTVLRQADGTYNVYVANGQALVLGPQSYRLAAQTNGDPGRLEVGYEFSSGSVSFLDPSLFQGGVLGGALSFRDEVLNPAQNALGRVAIALTQNFNDQHALGQDLNGVLGGLFFNVRGTNGASGANAVSAAAVLPVNATGSTPDVTLTDVSALQLYDYTLEYDGANYTLKRDSDGFFWNTGTSSWQAASVAFAIPPAGVTVDGMTIQASVGAAAGDKWLIRPTRQGASDVALRIRDPNQIAAAFPLSASSSLSNTGEAIMSMNGVASAANLPLGAGIDLTYDALTNSFTVAGASSITPAVYTDGGIIDVDIDGDTVADFSVKISGTPRDGDVFSITNNANGINDNSNALLLAALQTARTIGKDASVAGSVASASYQSSYGNLVGFVANKTQSASIILKAQESLVTQVTQVQQDISGVNLDEEAANLLRYQQAYQAAARVMQTASRMFDILLDLGG